MMSWFVIRTNHSSDFDSIVILQPVIDIKAQFSVYVSSTRLFKLLDLYGFIQGYRIITFFYPGCIYMFWIIGATSGWG